MASSATDYAPDAPHLPVLIDAILDEVSPAGTWIDGTFGAGGYTRAFLERGADVIAIDRDPMVFEMAESWADDFPNLTLKRGTFSELDVLAGGLVDGVVLDLGVSSMQLDMAERGFSFLRDGPLDMRMGQDGVSAADLVNQGSEALLADILFQYGEERASRRLAKAIIAARPFGTTLQLADVIEGVLGKGKPGHSHPATRSFQAIRIAVNDEYGQLAEGLEAAERALKSGGYLAVVTFHSVEDRMVKRFLQQRGGALPNSNRFVPQLETEQPAFKILTKKAVGPDEAELAQNPRARSAKLRVARRTDAPAGDVHRSKLGMPQLRDHR